ncbi:MULTISPECIES: N-formylglutamate amidohydrolase [Sphingomonas]|jgi:N-formylglutamate amidohydrolase|uniref:N-formylglutamate amidohydrolase n=1 Tax=Sphingomonas zeae TaxID=1646122 RepID=A0A7Y6EFP4_9SPHN|nr:MULTISPECIES: N-formylglutamate amidohydrolase [Sphingomonas]MBB4050121.1 N-formylglutamate amidohydrolase [Sphingomonas zeae]MDK8188283.1 N-formylglutamate amidohydrolase [Sphingomonas zeae]MDK8218166.1 N-formylglutamate amidohydrolase [Sphingomonas sp. UMB7805-LC452B]NUU45590.1 N-formylglutamate amidohydrolase [Sphingomonas zeae]
MASPSFGASFQSFGDPVPPGPVVISVPHGGRAYTPEMVAALRVPVAAVMGLEDRLIDLVGMAARGDEPTLIQNTPRAWIDLNRDERERDPLIDEGARTAPRASAKLRSGLGLVPRRVAGHGDIWTRRFADGEIVTRIEGDHRPYHRALAERLADARALFGVAVLLDLHSMPPLGAPGLVPRIVIGDRHGTTAATRFVRRIEAEARGAGFAVTRNAPYAGGHIVERHGDPRRGIHAVQLELDRSLYLDAALEAPGPGFDTTVALVRRILSALAAEALGQSAAMAAE